MPLGYPKITIKRYLNFSFSYTLVTHIFLSLSRAKQSEEEVELSKESIYEIANV